MPIIIDKRGNDEWTVSINSRNCPHIFFPRSDVACDLLEHGKKNEDSYCYRENCPLIVKTDNDRKEV